VNSEDQRVIPDEWQPERSGGRLSLGLLCFVLALVVGGLSAYGAADCERQDQPFALGPLVVGGLVIGGVFALTDRELLRFLGVIAAIVGGLLVLFIEFAVAMGSCFEI
jgi:hypothetical protein